MADIEITVDGGTSKRLLTAGKYCDKNILVTATGGGEPEPPDDGKTRLYITIPANAMPDRPPPRNQVPLYIQQTVANGVTIDWGDGTAPETLPGTGNVNTTHTYEQAGDYVISLDPTEGCELGLGSDSLPYCVMGSTGNNGKIYCNMLQKAYIGKNVINIGYGAFAYCYSLILVIIPDTVTNVDDYAFSSCYSLTPVAIPDTVTSIASYMFASCISLTSVTIPDNVTEIQVYAFRYCYSLAFVTIPNTVTSIESYAFEYCSGMKEYHFLSSMPPRLSGTSVFFGIPSDCIIYVPKGSAEAYKTATNWTTVADYIQEEPT